MDQDDVLLTAQFDPKVRIYWYVQEAFVHFMLIFGFVGLFTFPLWMVLGPLVVQRRYANLSCVLTSDAIHLKSGGWVKVEKTVPLEQIQDLSLRSGPFLNAFGLASVKVETAGNSGPNQADMTLPGLVDAREFRNRVLEQRRTLRTGGAPAPVAAPASAMDGQVLEVLADIRDTLKRLEARLPPE